MKEYTILAQTKLYRSLYSESKYVPWEQAAGYCTWSPSTPNGKEGIVEWRGEKFAATMGQGLGGKCVAFEAEGLKLYSTTPTKEATLNDIVESLVWKWTNP